MCLGIPGKVVEICEEGGLLTGRVDFSGVIRDICLSYIPEVQIGSYVLVHVGFAISQIDEEEAHRTLEILRKMGDIAENELRQGGEECGRPL